MRLTWEHGWAWAYTGGKGLRRNSLAVVFVHGALHDHSVWALQSRYLAHHGFDVLAVDLPGHGRTPGPALSIPDAARWLADAIDAAGLERVALVGHSMGSLICLEAAGHLGPRVTALVMVGTAYPMKVSPTLLQLAVEAPRRAIDLVNQLSHSTLAAKPSHPGPGFSLHGSNRALMRRMQDGYAHGNLFLHDFQACDQYDGLEDAARRLSAATTLILGSRDVMTPPRAAAILVDRLGAQVKTLASGHGLMGEVPDHLLDALLDVLQPWAGDGSRKSP